MCFKEKNLIEKKIYDSIIFRYNGNRPKTDFWNFFLQNSFLDVKHIFSYATRRASSNPEMPEWFNLCGHPMGWVAHGFQKPHPVSLVGRLNDPNPNQPIQFLKAYFVG
jgi:hypothetical protein